MVDSFLDQNANIKIYPRRALDEVFFLLYSRRGGERDEKKKTKEVKESKWMKRMNEKEKNEENK